MADASTRRQLVLLRHAKSSWSDPGLADSERPLASRGERAAGLIAAQLVKRKLQPDRVLCSTARRTRETWNRIRPVLVTPPEEVFEPELYLAEPRTLLTRIQQTPTRVTTLLVIGHNPGLQQLAASLVERVDVDLGEAIRAKFPTAALLALGFEGADWSALAQNSLELLAYDTPRELEKVNES
ncbi:MAG: SixA phosphatase family protein [Pseudomonadota bacterium]